MDRNRAPVSVEGGEYPEEWGLDFSLSQLKLL